MPRQENSFCRRGCPGSSCDLCGVQRGLQHFAFLLCRIYRLLGCRLAEGRVLVCYSLVLFLAFGVVSAWHTVSVQKVLPEWMQQLWTLLFLLHSSQCKETKRIAIVFLFFSHHGGLLKDQRSPVCKKQEGRSHCPWHISGLMQHLVFSWNSIMDTVLFCSFCP